MAVRKVREMGDDVLTKVSKEVKAMTERTAILIEDMLDTMYEANGVGLAAPQIGLSKKLEIFLFFRPFEPFLAQIVKSIFIIMLSLNFLKLLLSYCCKLLAVF